MGSEAEVTDVSILLIHESFESRVTSDNDGRCGPVANVGGGIEREGGRDGGKTRRYGRGGG